MEAFRSRDVAWDERFPLTMMTLWDGLGPDWRDTPSQGVVLAL